MLIHQIAGLVHGPGIETIRTLRLCIEVPIFRRQAVPDWVRVENMAQVVRWPTEGWRFESNVVDLRELPHDLERIRLRPTSIFLKCGRRRVSAWLFVNFGVTSIPEVNRIELGQVLDPIIGKREERELGMFYNVGIPRGRGTQDQTIMDIVCRNPVPKTERKYPEGVLVIRNRALQVLDHRSLDLTT